MVQRFILTRFLERSRTFLAMARSSERLQSLGCLLTGMVPDLEAARCRLLGASIPGSVCPTIPTGGSTIFIARRERDTVFRMQRIGPQVVIVGGGLAGIAAATELALRNIPTILLESRPRLGGRASSFLDATTNSNVDNCQHVAMGCCTNFAQLMQTLGLADNFRREDSLYFIGPSGRPDQFSASWWPCPFHLAGAFQRLSYLTWADKRAIAFGLKALAKSTQPEWDDQPFSDWLSKHEQTPGAMEGFWHVVLVSALSETLDRIAVPHARKVFVDGFLRHRNGWTVEIPTVPLESLYGPRLIEWFAERGVDVRLQSGVDYFEMADGRISAVRLRDGTTLAGDEFLLAVPFYRVADLLPSEVKTLPEIERLSELESAPITSLHLWFDRPVTDLPHAVLVGRLSQWMFNRTVLSQTNESVLKTNPGEFYYQVVISASRNLAGISQEEVLQAVLRELEEIWPVVREANILHHRLVTEHRAVFSVRPGVEKLRPAQQSPVENLQWAGDWTRTGWPGTMEGAVRSGYLAVENLLKRLGRPEPVLRKDLPVSFWSKWIFGIS